MLLYAEGHTTLRVSRRRTNLREQKALSAQGTSSSLRRNKTQPTHPTRKKTEGVFINAPARTQGILVDEWCEPMPRLLQHLIKRLVRWRVLPRDIAPDSAIVNLYDVEDCIPPHIDHHDFVRPFCTLSLLSEQPILFGAGMQILGPGKFDAPFSLPLPTGSVLVRAPHTMCPIPPPVVCVCACVYMCVCVRVLRG